MFRHNYIMTSFDVTAILARVCVNNGESFATVIVM